jgi:hypothetical protein
MAYILVTADFPQINGEQRKKIYECLNGKKWQKIHEPGRDIDTVWQASFEAGISEQRAIEITIEDFEDCSKPYCKPKLMIHWGPHAPTRHGLI